MVATRAQLAPVRVENVHLLTSASVFPIAPHVIPPLRWAVRHHIRGDAVHYVGRLDGTWRVFSVVPTEVLDVAFPTMEAAIVYAVTLMGGV